MRKLMILIVSILCLATACKNDPSDPSPKKQDLTKKVNKIIEPMLKENVVVGAAVGIINGEQHYQYFYGEKEKGKGNQPDENTLFEIGSIDKTFTAAILANMVLEGELQLEDTVKNFLPELTSFPEYNGQQVTLLNLANHTSSFPTWPQLDYDMVPDPYDPCNDACVEHFYSFLNSYQLPYPINSKWEYGNFAYGLLGHVLGKTKGTCIESLMQQEIWDELGMNNTYSLVPETNDNVAIPHFQDDLTPAPFFDFDACFQATGGSKSSIKDMLKYLEANLENDGTGLHQALRLTHKPTTLLGDGVETGLAWRRYEYNERKGTHMIFKTGGTAGSSAIIAFVPEENKGVVLLFNTYVRNKLYYGYLIEELYRVSRILEVLD